jgi:hypothetical protein
MSVSRKLVAVATISLATVALAVSFTGVASGAGAPAVPSAIVSVHANPGHVSTRIVGTSCGGFIEVEASGHGGGWGLTSCGHSSASVGASPGGSFNDMYASLAQAPLVCQANAQFATKPVDVVCFENVD